MSKTCVPPYSRLHRCQPILGAHANHVFIIIRTCDVHHECTTLVPTFDAFCMCKHCTAAGDPGCDPLPHSSRFGSCIYNSHSAVASVWYARAVANVASMLLLAAVTAGSQY